MAKPKAKRTQKLSFSPTVQKKLHRIQEIPIDERDESPEPRYREASCLQHMLINMCILMIITFLTILLYNFWPVPTECTKAEMVLHRSCEQKIARTLKIVENTIPDFSMTPIGRNVALKCQEMEDCLHAVECPDLKFEEKLPDRCALYQFFETDFKPCRERLNKSANLPVCVQKFMIAGPVDCNTLQEHAECYKEQVGVICDHETSLFHFWLRRYIDEYAQMIDCQLEYA